MTTNNNNTDQVQINREMEPLLCKDATFLKDI